jgi:hypothetical protein
MPSPDRLEFCQSIRGVTTKSGGNVEFLGRMLVPPTLYQNIQDVPILIHRPPQIIPFTVDGEKDLVQVPLVTWLGSSMTELIGICLAKLAAPLPDGFVRHDHPADEQEFFHVAVAETEAEVQPDAMADDLSREAVILVSAGRECACAMSIAHRTGVGQTAQ